MSWALRLILSLSVVWLVFALGGFNESGPFGLPVEVGGGFITDFRSDHSVEQRPVFQSEIITPDRLTKMVHVASVVELGDRSMVIAWYGGSAECASDVKIYLSRKGIGDPAWSKPVVILTREVVAKELGFPISSIGNAILLPGEGSELGMIFTTVEIGKWSGSQLNICHSIDGGMTWRGIRRLVISPLFNFSELVRNRPIPLEGNGWCVPIYHELFNQYSELLWVRETSGQLVLAKSRINGGRDFTQPSLCPITCNTAVAFFRNCSAAHKIFLSRTNDGGVTWSKPVATGLPNPDSGLSSLALSDGRILLAFNDSPLDRSNITLAVSSDQGASWKKVAVLESEPNAIFAYPYLMLGTDGLIRMSYTWKKKQIRLLTFNEAWIHEKEGSK